MKRAVIIGIDTYDDSAIRGLNYAKADANAIYDVLTDPDLGGFHPEHVTKLVDGEATKERIWDALKHELPGQAAKEDRVIIYFAGHGTPLPRREGNSNDPVQAFLVACDTRLDMVGSRGIAMEDVQQALETLDARQVVIFLDCCYSGAGAAGGRTVAPSIGFRGELSDKFLQDLAGTGRVVMTACGVNQVALESSEDGHGVFTHFLLQGLRGANEAVDDRGFVTFDRLATYVRTNVERRARELRGRMEPIQKGSLQGSVVLTEPHRKKAPGKSPARGYVNVLDENALDNLPGDVHCVVVQAELPSGNIDFPVEQHVRRAWDTHGNAIHQAISRYHSSLGRTRPATGSSGPPALDQTVLPIAGAFENRDSLARAVAAVSRADVAIFDITGFQPGTMMLLGVRSVARRGVTICSIGGEFSLGSELNLPFNLRSLNIAFHSRAQEAKKPDPLDILGGKLAQGFADLANLPHYLDLPAYDSVRWLGVDSAAYRPVEYRDQVLFLCPFAPAYSEANWERYLSKELPGTLRRLWVARGEVLESGRPRVVRLLDVQTPRLVAQTLYEAIRRTEMCVIDWTYARANVLFEAGVRLATNPLGGVHIIEKTADGKRVVPPDSPGHFSDMLELFGPIDYECTPGDTAPYDLMVRSFEDSLDSSNHPTSERGMDYVVYSTAGHSLDYTREPVAISVEQELLRSADLLASDAESTGISAVLYHDVNKRISDQADAAAVERRVAAWLYMDRRYSAADLAGSSETANLFRAMGAQIRRSLLSSEDPEDIALGKYITGRMRELRRTAAKPGEGGDGD